MFWINVTNKTAAVPHCTVLIWIIQSHIWSKVSKLHTNSGVDDYHTTALLRHIWKSTSLPNSAKAKQKQKQKQKQREFPEWLRSCFGKFDQQGNRNKSQSSSQNVYHDTPYYHKLKSTSVIPVYGTKKVAALIEPIVKSPQMEHCYTRAIDHDTYTEHYGFTQFGSLCSTRTGKHTLVIMIL